MTRIEYFAGQALAALIRNGKPFGYLSDDEKAALAKRQAREALGYALFLHNLMNEKDL